MVPGCFFYDLVWFLIILSRFSWFLMVLCWFFMVFRGSRWALLFFVILGSSSRLVCHGLGLGLVFQVSFHGFSCFQVGFHGFYVSRLVFHGFS